MTTPQQVDEIAWIISIWPLRVPSHIDPDESPLPPFPIGPLDKIIPHDDFTMTLSLMNVLYNDSGMRDSHNFKMLLHPDNPDDLTNKLNKMQDYIAAFCDADPVSPAITDKELLQNAGVLESIGRPFAEVEPGMLKSPTSLFGHLNSRASF
jgi:hypothetical protein